MMEQSIPVSKPRILDIKDKNTTNCPRCSGVLLREVKDGTDCRECDECRYDDRPFGWCRSDKGPCTCTYYPVKRVHLTCVACCVPKCKQCSQNIHGKEEDDFYSDYNKICDSCKSKNDELELEKKKQEFRNRWNSSMDARLSMYGVVKLRALAKKKNIKVSSGTLKAQLVRLLVPVTTDKDFPIRLE